jgi:hypothetical protein
MHMDDRRNVSFWLFLYGLFFSFFGIMPALISDMWKNPITWGDALDFLTPLAVIPVALALFQKVNKYAPETGSFRGLKTAAKVIFIIGVILYIEGHGIHLPSNSVSRLMEPGTAVYKAAYLFDEVISHYIWDSGVTLISVGLIILASTTSFPALAKGNYFLICLGAAFYGFTYSCNGIEGQTVLLTFPAAVLGSFAAFLLYFKNKKSGHANPVLLFFLLGYLISAVLFAYWGISHPGFPEFSALGWIK